MKHPWNFVFVIFTTLLLVVAGRINTVIGLVFVVAYSIFFYLLFLAYRKSDGLGFVYLWYLVILIPVLVLTSDIIKDPIVSFWCLVLSIMALFALRLIHFYLRRRNQDLYMKTFGRIGWWVIPLDKVLFGEETESKKS